MGWLSGSATTIREECRCGAKFTASGPIAMVAANFWRDDHRWCAARTRTNGDLSAEQGGAGSRVHRDAERGSESHPCNSEGGQR